MKMIRGVFHATAIVVLLFHTTCFAEDKAQDNAAECFKRAEHYYKEATKYANDVRDPGKWFDLAMKNALCAAKAGNAMAMLRVVNLSRSGQVAPLPKGEEEHYLMQAAEAGLPEAQIALSHDYCDSRGDAPCKHPAESERWLLRAAKGGSAWGVFSLGHLYEFQDKSGSLESLSKALACYRLSLQRYKHQIEVEKRGLQDEMGLVTWGIDRVEKKLADKAIQTVCYE